MNPKACLSELVDPFGSSLDNRRVYFDRQTGKVVHIEELILKAVAEGNHHALANLPDGLDDEPELAREILNDKNKRFVQFPSSRCNEDRVKAEFIRTVPDERIAANLKNSLKTGAFFRLFAASFVTVIYRFRLEEEWYRYRVETLKRFAIEWAKANSVPYEDDLKEDVLDQWPIASPEME